MADQPALLVDVDGVLNPGRHRGAGFTTHRLQPTGWTRTFDVALNPAHGAMLLEFAAANGVELVWATTWVDDEHNIASQLARRRKAGEVGEHLVVQVSPKSGLCDHHLVKAAKWLAQYAALVDRGSR